MTSRRNVPSERDAQRWQRQNHQYLLAALAQLRDRLAARAAGGEAAPARRAAKAAHKRAEDIAAEMAAPPALVQVGHTFGLSTFERETLLLCAAVELEGDFHELCAAIHGDRFPTFSLALATLPEPAWAAVTPDAPLRYWRLVELQPRESVTRSQLRIDERILHLLAGIEQTNEALAPLLEPLAPSALAPSHRELAERIAATWSLGDDGARAVVQLCGHEPAAKRAIAAHVGELLGVAPIVVTAASLPAPAAEFATTVRLFEREAALGRSVVVLDCESEDAPDRARDALVNRFVESLRALVLVLTPLRRRLTQRTELSFDVARATRPEQVVVWQSAAAAFPEHQIQRLANQFDLTAPAIHAACASAAGMLTALPEAERTEAEAAALLWRACREQVRPRLDDLAQRVEPRASWHDLVLPAGPEQLLRDIAAQVRHRTTVHETWGFARRSTRGLGIAALFSGSSGTGKTMAAEVLANELGLDIYRIDLSAVVSKYIGETEKNLRRVFDAADEGGAILLFDEADALFGKRSEVRDSHDRYANVEIGYLLQRVEAYRGLAVLTTNTKDALDTAFLRRLRFNVHFPFPDEADRARIWERVFPSETPTDQLDPRKLARLNVAGGNIRNIAINAAFAAAEDHEPVRMRHVLRSARMEYAKLDQALTESEIRGWL